MAKKVYLLTETMRSSKSGYFVEGTDISMDYPSEYPLPLETEVLEDGHPVGLRCLPHCSYLEKEKQIKNGFPVDYKWNDQDRKRVTFINRRLELDDKKDKLYMEFIERSAWMEGNEEKKSRDTTKTIFFIYDEDQEVVEGLESEEYITKAKSLVFGLDDSSIRNLYRLANPGAKNDAMMTLARMKKHLAGLCEANPGFILDGIKTSRDRIILVVSRAIEENLISLDFPGAVAIFNKAGNEWQNLVSVSDEYTREQKFDRLVEYLQTDQGATDLTIIESKLEESEPVEAGGLFRDEGDVAVAPPRVKSKTKK